ncbi:phosphatase PAP2 family protein [Saccharothrix syringae]|uniref:Uncharacterized protein n=1 Tax=Saccharothrix syringae TaxID=103733 RepID=A0A5Q0H1Z6_SACSY|nr:hypothetical protein [Saccharothrix syringae]QFZ20159.1 hypothetical protein EKG83_24565 [Saccharothrix syringae]
MKGFFGRDDIAFTATTEDPFAVGVERKFTSFSAAAPENARSRVCLGVRYQFDGDAGLAASADLAARNATLQVHFGSSDGKAYYATVSDAFPRVGPAGSRPGACRSPPEAGSSRARGAAGTRPRRRVVSPAGKIAGGRVGHWRVPRAEASSASRGPASAPSDALPRTGDRPAAHRAGRRPRA